MSNEENLIYLFFTQRLEGETKTNIFVVELHLNLNSSKIV